jgi:hypothetical protein
MRLIGQTDSCPDAEARKHHEQFFHSHLTKYGRTPQGRRSLQAVHALWIYSL